MLMTVYICHIINMTNSRHATINLENAFQGKLTMLQWLFKLYENELGLLICLELTLQMSVLQYMMHTEI